MFDAAIAAAAAAAPQVAQTVPMVPGLQLHVDGDYLAYYASGNDDTTPGQARQNALDHLDSFRSRVGAETIIVHNTGKGCHKGERYLIATVKPYQAQRAGGRKPKNHAYLQQWLMEYEGPIFRTKTWATREADDGIAACSHFGVGRAPGYVAIATADKDMRMLPGLHINWRGGQVTRVNPGDYSVIGEDGKQYGLKWFFLQMLQGDTADNCPGLEHYATFNGDGSFKSNKPVGEKTAEKLLEGAASTQEACAIVIDLYRRSYRNHSSGVADDRFCEQAALMWMRCDNTAAIADFAHHMGHSRINHNFDEDMWAAVKRLEDRITSARSEINSFSNQDRS
jgi:hypothetical protein